MSAAEFVHEVEALPEDARIEAIKSVLKALYPQSDKVIERLLRRIEHPEVPEEFWEGVEEIEDGKAIEMKDEHFDNPPM